MKKELLMGTALVSTLGAASVAEAVTATMSGNHQTGMEFDSPTGGTDTNAQTNDNNFTVSLSETTDGGMTISSSFKVMDENTKEDYDAGFTLAFTDGSKLDVINAGNASGSHAVSIPGSAGAEGVATTSTNSAQTGLDFMTASTVLGVEYHTASDFVADGMKMSFSASTDSGAAATSDVYFQVEVSVNGEAYTSAGTIIVGPNSQATIEKTNLSNGNTIRWRYKTSKDNVTYSTDFTESSLMTISCISGDDVSVVIPTTCNSDGTKTATVRTVNNSSSDKF